MNNVIQETGTSFATVADLLTTHPEETAFIGTCGCDLSGELYFMLTDAVALASNPRLTWGLCANVSVKYFVDTDIIVKERV